MEGIFQQYDEGELTWCDAVYALRQNGLTENEAECIMQLRRVRGMSSSQKFQELCRIALDEPAFEVPDIDTRTPYEKAVDLLSRMTL